LNVLKGDLNFRRAVGDVAVEIETPFEKLAVLPAAPMLSLRSIKSYCVAGVTDWPTGLSRTHFPMDGSILAVQRIPTRNANFSPAAPVKPAPSMQRFRQWVQRNSQT
jgi:hypothetical protein